MKRLAAFVLAFFAVCWFQAADAQFNRFSGCDREGFCPGTGGGPSGTPISNACINSSGTTITFTAQGIGPANPNRISVVSINWSDSTAAGTAELSSVTIGGTAMSRAVRASGDNQNSNSEIWYVANPTGTTANIVATFSTAVDGITIEVYSLIGFHTIAATTTGTTSVSQAYSNKQLAIAAGSRTVNVSTSLSNMTNDYSSACGASLWGVHASKALKGNSGTLTSAISPTTNNPKIALAVWQTNVATFPAISNVIGWWDASVFSSLTLTTNVITNIADQSGQGNNLGDGIAAGKPTYNAAGLNGGPSIVFDAAVVAHPICGTSTFPMGTGNVLTYWTVATLESTGAPFGRFVSYAAPAASQDYNNAGSFTFYRVNSGPDVQLQRNNQTVSPPSISLSTPYRFIITIDSSGNMLVYVNGVATGPTVSSGNWVTAGTLCLGRAAVGVTQGISSFTGETGIALSFSNSTLVGQLDTYLKTKWALP